jgi:tetratricopeptide (TPR) repeat protein
LAKARLHAEKAVAVDPYDPLAFCAKSIANFWQGNQVKALIAARQAAELDRGSQIAQGLIGCVQALSGHPKAALRALSVALKGSSKDPFRWFWLQGCANAFFALERYEEASDLARQVIEMRHGYIHGYVIHVASSTLAGQHEEARQSVEALLKLMPDYSIEMLRSHPIWSDRATITRLGESLLQAGLPESSC